MALFDDASLVTTPNGYKAGTLYSIKPTSGAGDMDVVRATTATRVNSAGLIESMANNVPRLDYSNGTCPCLLVEPQRTNLALYSEQFDNAGWIKSSSVGTVTVTANNTTSPDGTNNADRIVFPATPSGYSVVDFPFTATAANYTGSFYFKGLSGGETIWISYTKDGVNYNRAICNLTTSWQRFNLSALLTAGGDNFQFGVDTRDASQSPQGSQTVFAWGAQLELGSYPTSYIPTTSAAVTRNADEIYKTGISSLIGQTEGAMFLDFIFKTPRSTTDGQLGIANTSGSDRVIIWNNFTLNTLGFQIRANGANVISNVSLGSFVDGTRYKIAIAYKSGDTAVYVNGSQIITDSSAFTFPTSVTDFILGSYAIPYQCHQRTNATALWKTRLTNAELAQLTTI